MQLSEKEHELISKYLDREASEADIKEITTLKESSQPFREELLKQKAIVSALKAQEKARKIEAVRAMVAAYPIEIDIKPVETQQTEDDENTPVIPFKPEDNTKSGTSHSTSTVFMRYAAAIVVLLAVSLALFNLNGGMSSQEIYAAYYQPLDAAVSTRSESQDKVVNPLDPYIAGDYEASIPTLEAAIGEAKNAQMLSVYLGISLLEVGRVDEARSLFSEIYGSYPNDFPGQHAEWYLAMIMLKEDSGQAQQAFQQIVDQQGMYENQARKVLEEM